MTKTKKRNRNPKVSFGCGHNGAIISMLVRADRLGDREAPMFTEFHIAPAFREKADGTFVDLPDKVIFYLIAPDSDGWMRTAAKSVPVPVEKLRTLIDSISVQAPSDAPTAGTANRAQDDDRRNPGLDSPASS